MRLTPAHGSPVFTKAIKEGNNIESDRNGAFFFFFFFLRATPTSYGSFQAGVKSELWQLACTTATAMSDP